MGAGGRVEAMMVFWAGKMAERKIKVYTVMGAASRAELLDFMDLKRLTRKIAVATNDGSHGHKGLVTDILSREIEETDPERIFACGPAAMLQSVAGISRRYEIP